MQTLFSKKFAIAFSGAALIAFGVYAFCAGGFDEGYDPISNFTPEAYVDASYSPLFASWDVFYRIGFDTEHVSRFNNEIEKDWTQYLAGKMSADQVKFFLLKKDASAAINQLYQAITQHQKAPAEYAALNLRDARVQGFVTFMHYANIIEKSSVRTVSWVYDDSEIVPVNAETTAAVKKLYESTQDAFLKNRYWFQTMKAYFYGTRRGDVITFFDNTEARVPKNTLYYRGLSYVAGAYHAQEDVARAGYLYSRVFDKCPPLRTVTAYCFSPENQTEFYDALALATTPQEKAALWALYGYHASELEAIEKIYDLDPKSPHLDFLLTRLINHTESDLNNSLQKSNNAQAYREALQQHLPERTLQLVTNLAEKEKTSNPALWYTAAGYLNIFAGNHTKAESFFEKAGAQKNASKLASQEVRLFKLLNKLYSLQAITPQAAQTLLPELTWLYALPYDDTFRFQEAVNRSREYLSWLYRAQGDLVMAELFYKDQTYYHTEANQEAMKKFMQAADKTPWQTLAMKYYAYDLGDLFEYQAVMNTYAGNLKQALEYMKASNHGSSTLLANPFNGFIIDCHDCEHSKPQSTTYTKLDLLSTMAEMKEHIDRGEDVYNNALLLANAYYSITYAGNARKFYEDSDILGQYGNHLDEDYYPQLLNWEKADLYYQKAFTAATNDEQRAKCTYLRAKCERNAYYTENYYDQGYFYGHVDVAFLAWDGFQKLKTNYAHTQYYKYVIRDCGYFAKYAAR